MDYPITYPCPTWEYGQGVSPFASRTQFDCGWARQRRQWPESTKTYSMTFKMTTEVFSTWFDWVNTNGYVWFNMTMNSGQLESIRFISEVQYAYGDYNVVIARVTVEEQNG